MNSPATETRMRRWQEQRWILDAIVQTVGVEWDQARLAYTMAPAGVDAVPDFMAVRMRVKKYNDIDREFASAARRRQDKARRYEEEGRLVSAGESYFIAALLWSAARWPIFENSADVIAYNDQMVGCYEKYIAFARHPIERVEVPFEGKSLPGYLHLPHAPAPGERFPCVLSVDGMDASKEIMCSMYGDKWLERGMASFCLDGPGQGECCVRDIHVTATNHMDAGKAAFEWLATHPAIDADRIVVSGVSFGSYFGTQIAAALGDRVKGCAVQLVCHEPGGNSIFNMASPTFKLRFMYMAGIDDEAEFDAFAKDFDIMRQAASLKCPYLVLAGEHDELSPIEHTYRLFDAIQVPKKLVVYEAEKHGIGGAMSAQLGDNPNVILADWLRDRADGKPMQSERVFIDSTGRPHVTPV
ncbi:MAG: alpha/beta hydrolase [Chloroflexi bacterium]|nr:alpha/beta hydrolase [Chloroflexota bacterium]